jgi:hypothetical protein
MSLEYVTRAWTGLIRDRVAIGFNGRFFFGEGDKAFGFIVKGTPGTGE